MSQSINLGRCPSCELEVPIGGPCGERGCLKRGYHGIPLTDVAALDTRTVEAAIGTQVDEYLLVGVLGVGGFGKVYRALQMPIRMPTALKLMHPHIQDDPNFELLLRKFEGEAQALATLSHPNIVRLLKYGTHKGSPYLVMELVEGARTLKMEVTARAMRGLDFSPREVFHILRQCSDAMEAAHTRQIVHRDIKPENIMLQEVAGNPDFVRILDFGLAKFVADSDETSVAMGTPVYMAPEQITRKNIGPWTDLYAIGVVTFELLTGRRAFAGRTQQQILASKLDPSFDPIEAVKDLNLQPALAQFLRRALSRDPADRYRSASELRKAMNTLEQAMEGGTSDVALSSDLTGLLDSTEVAQLDTLQRRKELERRTEADPTDSTLALAAKAPPKVIIQTGDISDSSDTLDAGQGLDVQPAPSHSRLIFGSLAGLLVVAGGLAFGLTLLTGDKAPRESAPVASTTTGQEATTDRKPDALPSKSEGDVSEPKVQVGTSAKPTPQEATPIAKVLAKAPPLLKTVPTDRAPDPTPAFPLPSEMVKVEGGNYPLGCVPDKNANHTACWQDAQPAHRVTVGAFGISRTEITMEAFDECVAAGKCTTPTRPGKHCVYGKGGHEQSPMNCVSHVDATAYCAWRGWKLPTEAQWEIASSGPEGRAFPWGSKKPTCDRTQMAGCDVTGPRSVGTRPQDTSWCGAVDLGGNVREWTRSLYGPYPGGHLEDDSDTGKPVNRGNSFLFGAADYLTSHARGVDRKIERRADLGFRCVLEAP